MIAPEIRAWLGSGTRIGVEPVSLMEEWMPRHFGLKATSVIERAGSTRVSDPTPALAAPTAPSLSLSPDDTPESKLSSPGLALPFSPASWRGCHGRRSISAH
jgi:hypothetical protein